jgi:NADH-quinone oxidoreductase subunit J
MGLQIAFWVLAVVAVGGAVMVVAQKNVFRAALTLIACFLAVAGLFVTLSADFLAAIQILVYVGAIAILIILGVMLTRDTMHASVSNKMGIPVFIVCGVLLGILIYVIGQTDWSATAPGTFAPTVADIGLALFQNEAYLLALEITPILLLAAIIGAIVLVREK